MTSRIRNVFSTIFRLFVGWMNNHRFKGPRPSATADENCLAGSGGFLPFRRFLVASAAELDVAIDRLAEVGKLRIVGRFFASWPFLRRREPLVTWANNIVYAL